MTQETLKSDLDLLITAYVEDHEIGKETLYELSRKEKIEKDELQLLMVALDVIGDTHGERIYSDDPAFPDPGLDYSTSEQNIELRRWKIRGCALAELSCDLKCLFEGQRIPGFYGD
jgi:hypothetical protein